MTRFENGFDSYKNAINELENRNQDEYRLKGVIINYHHAIEVMVNFFDFIPFCFEWQIRI